MKYKQIILIAIAHHFTMNAIYIQNATSNPPEEYKINIFFNAPPEEWLKKNQPDGKTQYVDRENVARLKEISWGGILKPGEFIDLAEITKNFGIFERWPESKIDTIILKRLPFKVVFTPVNESNRPRSEITIDIDDAKGIEFLHKDTGRAILDNPCRLDLRVQTEEQQMNWKLCQISQPAFGIVISNKNGWHTQVVNAYPKKNEESKSKINNR